MPLQAGSDRILEKMRRTYTQQEFLDLAAEIRTLVPGICLSTDLIAGFPTETDAEFEATVAVLERVRFDSAFIFKYSERRNTIAQRKYPDDVPAAVKTERVVRLNAIQKEISLERNRAYVGRTLEVILEGPSRKSAADLLGRDDGNHGVVIPRGDLRPGIWWRWRSWVLPPTPCSAGPWVRSFRARFELMAEAPERVSPAISADRLDSRRLEGGQ